jgi:hypothetical protein
MDEESFGIWVLVQRRTIALGVSAHKNDADVGSVGRSLDIRFKAPLRIGELRKLYHVHASSPSLPAYLVEAFVAPACSTSL